MYCVTNEKLNMVHFNYNHSYPYLWTSNTLDKVSNHPNWLLLRLTETYLISYTHSVLVLYLWHTARLVHCVFNEVGRCMAFLVHWTHTMISVPRGGDGMKFDQSKEKKVKNANKIIIRSHLDKWHRCRQTGGGGKKKIKLDFFFSIFIIFSFLYFEIITLH